MLTINNKIELAYIYEGLCELENSMCVDKVGIYAWINKEELKELTDKVMELLYEN